MTMLFSEIISHPSSRPGSYECVLLASPEKRTQQVKAASTYTVYESNFPVTTVLSDKVLHKTGKGTENAGFE